MKIALFNDTAPFAHFGCQAVSDGHARMLGRAGHEVTERFFLDWWPGIPDTKSPESVDFLLNDDEFRRRIEPVDAVVVNGEGTIHHGAGLHLLAVLGAAQRLRKKTLLVNAVYEETEYYEDVINKLDDFTVRDIRSLNFAQSRGLKARLLLDSSFAAHDVPDSLADISKKAVVSDWHTSRSGDVGDTLKQYMRNYAATSFFLPFERADAAICWHRIVATLKHAAVFLSARHHGICFAVKAGVPFVGLPSNTSKVEGFLEAFAPKVPVAKTFSELQEAEAWAIHQPQYFRDISARIADAGPIDTFSVLGSINDESGEAREVARLADDVNRHRFSYLMNGEWETIAIERRMKDALRKGDVPMTAKLRRVQLVGVLGGVNPKNPLGN
ncbi:polysaccharide pyruvyl transferase family protein [Brucella pseudintermedia]|uniref:Polysaccharide pyruvyl transferase family protein n=1 Tax=Brucella pseudintermedia TaxID=370111 RepID=A0ABY5UA85_9HYPH|nr:polysaccharide pyruvyl transferase family protein [Brucella pseudintermedia]UWL60233.1 polysaccharide pyruvyl transferase family protein [Brucella pseudintermedia]